MENIIDQLVIFATSYGLKIIGAVFILSFGRVLAGFARKGLKRLLRKSKTDEALISFTSGLIFILIMVFTVIAALAKFGVQTTSIVAVLGAAGFAAGFALQGSLANFAAGVMLLVFRPFRLGDLIEVAGVLGIVAVSELADSSVNFVVRPWVKTDDYWDVRFDLTRKIKEKFDDSGIEIPFPQRVVHLSQEAEI